MLSWIDVSPADNPLRSFFTGIPAVYLAYLSLQLLKSLNSGTTLTLQPKNPLLTFRVHPGKFNLTPQLKKAGFIKSYNGPLGTAFLGMLLFSAAQFLLVMMFKRVDYIF